MISYYTIREYVLCAMSEEELKNSDVLPIWVDVTDPTSDEIKIIASIFNINISMQNEVNEVKMPSCYYQQKGQVYAKINIAIDDNVMQSIAIILSKDQIITTQLAGLPSCLEYLNFAIKNSQEILTPNAIFSYFIEARINEIEGGLDKIASSLDELSKLIFYSNDLSTEKKEEQTYNLNLKENINYIGKDGHRMSKHHESLISIRRALNFMANSNQMKTSPSELEKFNDLLYQVSLLEEHLSFLSDKISFLLDITFGMIDIEQNAISKVLSIAALIFLPPAIIAGVYGMNFAKMPLINEDHGFFLSVLLIIVSATLPYTFCKLRRWI